MFATSQSQSTVVVVVAIVAANSMIIFGVQWVRFLLIGITVLLLYARK